ncbi:hypothetical protein HWV62_29727 [Athelia sp. TMB]|nr:hypothetical protein HWV62_29727 [Athelia sp. TMB]
MSMRIRELEEALALLQASISAEKHTLLRDELPLIKTVSEKQRSAEPDVHEDPLADTVDAFGTLTIGDGGEFRYLGASAGSETLLSAKSEPEDSNPILGAMPELLNNLAATFPMGSRYPPGPEASEAAMVMLFSCLPPIHRAWSLCESFIEKASWLFRPVQRDELIEDILTPIYIAKDERENPLCVAFTEVFPHKLSTLYSIFALGVLVDLTLPAFGEEGERYHHCARAALVLRPILDSPMVETVQSILLMIVTLRDGTWTPKRLSGAELCFGRSWEQTIYTKSVATSILEVTLGAKAPDYKTILELDRKVHEMPLPANLRLFLECDLDEAGLDIAMKGGHLTILRAVCLLYIHKNHFARALIDHPADPLRSPYATSFLVTTRCSSTVIRLSYEHIKRVPKLCARFSFPGKLVVGLIVTRAPSSSMAPAAFTELSIATELFEICARHSHHVRAGMDILHRLRDKASSSLNLNHSGSTNSTLALHDEENDLGDLAIYSGQMGGQFSRARSPRLPVASNRAADTASLSPESPVTPAASTGSEGQSTDPGSWSSDSVPPEGIVAHGLPRSSKGHPSLFPPRAAAPKSVFSDQSLRHTPAPPTTMDNSAPVSFSAKLPPSEPYASKTSSHNFAYESLVEPFQQLYSEMLSPGTEMGVDSETGTEMDEDWTLFMKESGLL